MLLRVAIIFKSVYDSLMATSNSNPILQKIQEKELARDRARADIAQLDLQIKTLHQTLEMLEPTEYERYLKSQESKESQSQISAGPLTDDVIQNIPVRVDPPKNHKGSLTPVILSVLADRVVRSIDDVLPEVNAQMEMPTTRASLRATLGNLKNAGKISSPGYGKYQGLGKEENPADVVATNDNGGVLNVQSNPLTGQQ